jgi:outer membrane protein OmpA-like peptidoglycan-associated protein
MLFLHHIKVSGIAVGLCLGLLADSVMAVRYESEIIDSEWLVNLSIFECQLSHGIPQFGDAVFFQKAGEEQKFFLSAYTPRLKAGQALLRSEKPAWKKRGSPKELGYVAVTQGKAPIFLDTQMSQRVLTELHQGMEVTITRRPWYGGDASIEVGISAVNFRAAYDQYLICLSSLLPVNFEQIERSSIYFGSSKEALLPSEMAKIDNIGLYYQADNSITTFYVDGHTDSQGARQDNFELSRERAEMVSKFLVARGIPPESIVTRWHGERYPVASNETRTGRAQNRRVTIRLVRGTEEDTESFEPQLSMLSQP